jgi:hypothetical protein
MNEVDAATAATVAAPGPAAAVAALPDPV